MVNPNKNLFFSKENHKEYVKKQIILLNTNYNISDFLKKIELRYNGKYDKIPTFSIDKSGFLYQHLNVLDKSNLFYKENRNEIAITIALENIGWVMEKNDYFEDFIGRVFENDVFRKYWRGYSFWDKYSLPQYSTLFQLLDYLCLDFSIERDFIGHNTLSRGTIDYNGILNRCNFSKYHYDLNPSFDFDGLSKYLKKEI